jgi:UDP-N-acetylglucosamine 4,6-dehydratase/5-epimerase
MEKILLLGGTGSLGHTLTKRFLARFIIYIYSRDENKQWLMKLKFDNHPHLFFIIGDIADKARLEHTLYKCSPNYIIIAAALKHIDICEYNTYECIKTNIIGIQNCVNCIATASLDMTCALKTVLFVSSDKACSPVNVYGMCKAISERIVIEKSLDMDNPKFVVVRYGNVLNSRGSLLPKFHYIGSDSSKEAFTVTDEKMTRFFMTLEESVNLIEYSLFHGENGVTYVPLVKSYRILDLAKYFSQLYKKPIKFTGIRPGEKMHETLINDMELRRSFFIAENKIWAIFPPYQGTKTNFENSGGQYSSDTNISSTNEEIEKICQSIIE